MIRNYQSSDIEQVIQIWLEASIKAHHFIPEEFWQSQIDNMRNIYLPSSEVYVFELDSSVAGFYALYEDKLAAIFVSPDKQHRGIGKQLIDHAKQRRTTLTLNVYKENQASYQFYLSQGFKIETEQADPHTEHLEYVMCYQS